MTCDNAGARTVNGVLSVGNFNLTSVTARTFLAALLKPCCLPPVREPIEVTLEGLLGFYAVPGRDTNEHDDDESQH